MNRTEFEGCCTADIIYGFGNGANCDHTCTPANTKEQALEFIRDNIRSVRAMGGAQVLLIVNNDQKILRAALDELEDEVITSDSPYSIIYSPWMKSNNHSTLCRTYMFQLHPDPDDFTMRRAGVTND